MELFEHTFDEIKDYIAKRAYISLDASACKINWPGGGGRNVVLSDEMALELGNPQMESASSLIWTERPDLVCDGRMTLIGPDIRHGEPKSMPFGKIVLIGVSGFNEDNTYDRYKEIESIRYAIDLKGYMMRAVSQYQREWSRISREAVRDGFSFEILGSALRKEYLKKNYIHAVEFLFVTSSSDDVRELQDITKNVSRTINAMDKMINEIDADCDDCEYNDVCDEVEGLRRMKKSNKKERASSNG